MVRVPCNKVPVLGPCISSYYQKQVRQQCHRAGEGWRTSSRGASSSRGPEAGEQGMGGSDEETVEGQREVSRQEQWGLFQERRGVNGTHQTFSGLSSYHYPTASLWLCASLLSHWHTDTIMLPVAPRFRLHPAYHRLSSQSKTVDPSSHAQTKSSHATLQNKQNFQPLYPASPIGCSSPMPVLQQRHY